MRVLGLVVLVSFVALAGDPLPTQKQAVKTLSKSDVQAQVTDGTNVAAVKAASTAPGATDPALVVSISPNTPIGAANTSIGNTGSATPAAATTIGGTDGTNLRAVKVSSTGVVSVDGSGVTQPVSGTVTANQGGTWTVQPGNTANTTAWKTTDVTGGATGSAVPANAIQAGAVSTALGSAPTASAAGNLTALAVDTQNRLLVSIAHPNYFSCVVTGTTSITQCQAAPGSGSLYITDVWIGNGTTAQSVGLVSGTTTTTACDTNQANISHFTSIAASGNSTVSFTTPLKVAAQKILCCKNSGATAFGCTVSGYTAP